MTALLTDPATACERAADLIERNGLYQDGWYYDRRAHHGGTPLDECRMCTAGAYYFAASGDPEGQSIHRAPIHEYARSIGIGNVPLWNDDPTRMAEEAVEFLRSAANYLRENPA
jgi:hypothetical protein